MKSSSQFESFENRRKYPRLNLHIPVKVQSQNGKCVSAKLYDISPDGLQIRCDQEVAGVIHPGGKQIKEGEQPKVTVGFNLLLNGKNTEIIVRCSMCYFALLTNGENNEVAFGLRFRKFKGKCLQHLKQFLLSEMEPA
jgi:c-di-GMP-binding flagellar brake protein YcgR